MSERDDTVTMNCSSIAMKILESASLDVATDTQACLMDAISLLLF